MIHFPYTTPFSLPSGRSRRWWYGLLTSWMLSLVALGALAQGVNSARIEEGATNRLTVIFSEPITVSDASGFRLVGGVARIDQLLSGSGTDALTFSLTDYVLSDDAFTLLHWPEMSDARSSAGKLGAIDQAVVNDAMTYKGSGKLYYVSTVGNDNNSGTSPDSSFKTIGKAQTVAGPGDYVLLKRGDTFDAFEINKSGSKSGGPIVYAAYSSASNAKPKVSGRVDLQDLYPAAILINRQDYIIVDNLHIISNRNGVSIVQTGEQLVISNCRLEGAENEATQGGIDFANVQNQKNRYVNPQLLNNTIHRFRRGIHFSGYPYNGNYEVEGGTVENNTIRQNREVEQSDGMVANRGDFNGLVFRKNDVAGYYDDGIDIYGGHNVIIEHNAFHNPGSLSANTSVRRRSGNGIKAGGIINSGENTNFAGTQSSGVIVRYNTVRDIRSNSCPCNGIVTNSGVDGSIYGNLVYNVDGHGMKIDGSSSNWTVYNNTVVNAAKPGFQVYVDAGVTGDLTVKNNIFGGNSPIDISDNGSGNLNIDRGNNIPIGGDAPNGTKYEEDVLFSNSTNNDYRLKIGSPAVDAGTGTVSPYERDIRGFLVDSNPDIGAYEFGDQFDAIDPPTNGQNPVSLLLAGASLTLNDNDPEQGWGEELAPLLNNKVTIKNRARPGTSTKSFITRGHWSSLLNEIQRGDYVVINFGHNDRYASNDEDETTAGSSPDYNGTYKANLKRMAQDVLNRNATPIIASPGERAIFNNYVLTTSHGEYVPAAQKAAEEAGVTYIDFNKGTRDWIEVVGEASIEAYFPGYRSSSPGTTDRSSDATHTNTAGARKNAEALVSLLQASNSPLKQYIKDQQPPVNSGNGIAYSYYEGNWTQLPDFSTLTAIKTGTLTNFSLNPAQREDYYGLVYTTYLEVSTAGSYTFYTNSDDGTRLYLDGTLVVDNDGVRAPVEESGSISLSAGRHQLTVEYFEAYGGQLLEVRYAGPGISKQLIPGNLLYLEDNTVPPTASTEVWLETECADNVGSAWEALNDNTASQDSYLKVIPGNSSASSAPTDPNKQLVFNFSVSEAGQYTIYTRQRENGSNTDDSFWLKVNGESWTLEGLGGPANSFYWEATNQTYNLSAGNHTLTIGTREDNTQLDKIYITLNGNAPSGEGEVASNCNSQPPPPSNSVVTANAGQDRTVSVNVSQPYQIRGGASGPNPFRRFLWEKVSGPSLTLNGNSANARLSNLRVGTYVLRFTATDSEGNSGSNEMTLTVTGSNARTASGAKDQTSVTDVREEVATLSAYPNPTSKQLTVRLPTHSGQSGILWLTDLAGKQVWGDAPQTLLGGDQLQLDLRNVPAGIYLLRWQADRLYTTKVLIER